jgi:hypothetical protein
MTQATQMRRVPASAGRPRAARQVARVPAPRSDASTVMRRLADDELSGLLQRCVSGRCCSGDCATGEEQRAKRAQVARSEAPPAASDALGGLLARSVATRAPRAMLARVCAPKKRNLLKPDKEPYGVPTKWKLTIAVDREAKSRWGYILGDVGHTWVKLSHDQGELWTFGMWPQQFFNALKPGSPVPGCIHHPDTDHDGAKGYKEITYDLNEKQYEDALGFALDECERRPDYNLLHYNCTHFAIETARQARVKPPPAETLSVPNPNTIYEGIEDDLELQKEDTVRARAAAYIEPVIDLPDRNRPRQGALVFQ